MVSLFSSARASALSAMICALFTSAALAADMPFPFAPPPANDGPVEWGTGWYLRGDIGAAKSSLNNINGVVLSPDTPNNWTIGVGGGYQYNNWFRTDMTVDYEELYSRSNLNYRFVPCPGAPAQPCLPYPRATARTIAILSNAYFDLGNWGGFTPYVGAGVGADIQLQETQLNWYNANIALVASLPQTNTRYWRFAYALMGGVAYDLTDHIKIDLGYRWINLGDFTGLNLFNNLVTRNVNAHQLRLGFRYVID
jgi:opacity protein-like surface antigen